MALQQVPAPGMGTGPYRPQKGSGEPQPGGMLGWLGRGEDTGTPAWSIREHCLEHGMA